MNNRFVIIVGSRNNSRWVEDNINSILNQDYINYKVIYFDDASEDDTFIKANLLINSDQRFILDRSDTRVYKTWFFANLDKYFDVQDNDILVFLDGDDMFYCENVLSYLNVVYNKTNCWMTYGGMIVWEGGDTFKEPYPQNLEIPYSITSTKSYRKDIWRTSHLKSMRGFIWKNFNKKDLCPEGIYEPCQDDLAIMYSALEMCPPEKIFRVSETIYLYNGTPENGGSRGCTELKTKSNLEIIIRSKTPYNTLSFVTPTLAGGLGNQMFEVAAAIALSKDNNAVTIINPTEHILPNQGRNINTYLTNIFSRIVTDTTCNPINVYEWSKSTYKPIQFKENIKLRGHFQSYKYFDHHREYIQTLFSPTDEIKQYIQDKYTSINDITAIQVRRGDYAKFPNHHPLLSEKYYNDAVNMINPSEIWIFSDSIEWCKENLKFNCPVKYINEEDYIELYLISLCKNVIISNSSFGWWGAYLNTRHDKKVYVPSTWFGEIIVNDGFNMDDLILPEWIRI
jgi:glycosyltransferase involved in cell wall biosynthesis